MSIYRGVGGVNREISTQYRGVAGVNREVNEQWRGFGGVSRLVFSSVKINRLCKKESSHATIYVYPDYSKVSFDSTQPSTSDMTSISAISIILAKPIPAEKLNIQATIARAYGSAGSSVQIAIGYQGAIVRYGIGGVKLTADQNDVTNYPMSANGGYGGLIDEIQIAFVPPSGRSKSIRGEIRNKEIWINGVAIDFSKTWGYSSSPVWYSLFV